MKYDRFLHAQQRAWERYKIYLTKDKERYFVKVIESNPSKYFVRKLSRKRSLYSIPYKNMIVKIAYQKNKKNIHSFYG